MIRRLMCRPFCGPPILCAGSLLRMSGKRRAYAKEPRTCPGEICGRPARLVVSDEIEKTCALSSGRDCPFHLARSALPNYTAIFAVSGLKMAGNLNHSPKTDYDPTNPLIVQGDRSILVEVDNPRYAEARDALAPFAELEKSPEHIHT